MSGPQKIARAPHGGNRAIALVLVLSFLVLITALVIAFFASVTLEHSTAGSSANAVSSRELADSAVQVVLSNIKSAAQSKDSSGNNVAWASQPGMIRTYKATGDAASDYKLYSSDNMVVSLSNGATFDPGSDFDPQWAKKPAMFTDLNSPISSGGNAVFPIIDGNAIKNLTKTAAGQATKAYLSYDDYDSKNNPGASGHPDGLPDIEGFGVDPASVTYDPSKAPSTTNTPVPMPVKWMYVLRDGTLTTPTAVDTNTGTIASFAAGATQPSAANPIVGRMSFWTDDESTKININTASEGNFSDVPRAQGVTDMALAYMPPVQKEYQRYPGHPFTTCLSTVLGAILPVNHALQASMSPGGSNGYWNYSSPNPATYAPYKPYYDLAPRLNIDKTDNLGSQAGTSPSDNNMGIAALSIKDDRLFTDVSELMFEPLFDASSNRVVTNTENNLPLISPLVSRTKFFLTASSRAPDVNLYGLPRIVTWPLSEKTGETYRTFLDNQIAFCGTINATNQYTYYFQRFRNDHPTYDLPASSSATGVGRNRTLMNYLKKLTSQNVPGFGGNFASKYPAGASGVLESDQILTEIFDYIRCLDLWDQSELGYDTTATALNAFHPYAPPAKPGTGTNPANNTPESYNYTSAYYAYTNPGSDGGGKTGMGQVVPIYDTTTKTRGFGRFATISEVSLVFVATGWNDGKGGTKATLDPNYQGSSNGLPNVFYRKNGTAPPWGFYNQSTTAIDQSGIGVTVPDHPVTFEPSYGTTINRTSQNGTVTALGAAMPPVDPGTIQVQAMLLLNWFDPAQGHIEEWGSYNVQIDGLDKFSWQGINETSPTSMGFPQGSPTGSTNNPLSVSTMTSSYGNPYGVSYGGNIGFRNFTATGKQVGMQPSAVNYYPYLSIPKNFTYNPALPRATTQPFSFKGGKITINVLIPQNTPPATTAGANWPSTYGLTTTDAPNVPAATAQGAPNQVPVQQIIVNFPSGQFPLPYYGSATTNVDNNQHARGDLADRLNGGYSSTISNANTKFIADGDTVRSVRAYPGDMRLIAGKVKVDASNPSNASSLFPSPNNSSNLFEIPATGKYINDPATGLTGWKYADPTARKVHSLRDSNDTVFNGAILGQLVPTTFATYFNTSSSLSPGYENTGNTPPTNFSAAGNCATNGAYLNNDPTKGFGDWDNGFGGSADGPYINKPEEGAFNYYSGDGGAMPYFGNMWGGKLNQGLGSTFFSPNRLMPSPVMFGSLSTGVQRNLPWQTLLFCPNPPAENNHPGFGVSASGNGVGPNAAPPLSTPPDHLLLDLFNMPVVEPYPISEPLSTAGRINMNYQIAPFTYITRNTGLRAVLKAERLTAIPNSAGQLYKKNAQGGGYTNAVGAFPLNATYDYRIPIDADQTLLAFDNYFNTRKDIFRSASQICEMFLYPTRTAEVTSTSSGTSYDTDNTSIKAFWASNLLTGDNSREKPYADIYPRLTTKSNTYTVHVRVQTLKKSINTDPTTWIEGKDIVQSEYRGSSTVERYVDPADPTLPDYANPSNTDTLDSHYKFRVISNTQFSH